MHTTTNSASFSPAECLDGVGVSGGKGESHYATNSASFSTAECLDGFGVPKETDALQKWRESHAPAKDKKYTIIFKSILDGSNRSFSVRANSVVEAVRACRAAHPNADIVEVY